MVLVIDSRPRLERANMMLQALIDCKFLIDQEAEYKPAVTDALLGDAKITDYKLTSTDFVGPQADLRRLVTKAGLAWLRASAADLKDVVKTIDMHPKHPDMCKTVTRIFREYGYIDDLRPDGRPKINRIWRVFYVAQLFASGTHYIIFDQVEEKSKPVISTLGIVGTICISGSSKEHQAIVQCIADGSPLSAFPCT